MSPQHRWVTSRMVGTAADLHAQAPQDRGRRHVWLMRVVRAALVLGSGQGRARVNEAALRAADADVVRRRSGGGAVWLDRESVWIDVFLPPGDPLWEDDVGRSFDWLGATWLAALADLGMSATVHRGPYRPPPTTPEVCFAGRGPGEVFVGEAKVVGISQRRTREGARFQCLVPRLWDPKPLVGALGLHAHADLVASAALPVDQPRERVENAFVGRLP